MSARAMRDSGVPWIGEIPVGWEVVRLGKLSESYCDGPFGSNLKSEHYVPAGVRVIRLQNVGACRFVDDDAAYVSTEHYAALTRHGVRPGDIVVAGLGDDNHPVGRAFVVPASLAVAMVKADCFRFRVDRSRADAAFICWFLASAAGNREAAQDTKGSTRLRINLSGAARVRVPLPPLDEQRRIATFLNARTAAIDSAIAEHETALVKLAERRQSLISHAVTRGLDHTVPTRGSGRAVIGELPAHWTHAPLARVLDRIEQGWSPQCLGRPAEEGEWGVLKAGCVNFGTLDADENKALPADLSPVPSLEVRRGDLLMNRASGSDEHVGAVGLVETDVRRLMLCDKVYRLHLHAAKALPEWVLLVLRSHIGRTQIRDVAMGQSSLKNISQAEVRRLHIPLPPLDEQRAIVAHLRERAAAIDAAADAARRAVALLREYRQSLVTAAVTGRVAPEEPRA